MFCDKLKPRALLLGNLPTFSHTSVSAFAAAAAAQRRVRKGPPVSELAQLKQDILSLDQGKPQPDSLEAYARLLRRCCELRAVSDGRYIHQRLRSKGLLDNQSLANLVLSFYGKCGCLQDTIQAFEALAARDIVSWNAMISAFAVHGNGQAGLRLLAHMQLEGIHPNRITVISLLNSFSGAAMLQEGKLVHGLAEEAGFEQDVAVASALVNMYGRCESLEDASRVFGRIPNPNVVAWNVIIGVYARRGDLKISLQYLEQMQTSRVNPDKVTFLILVDACGRTADLVRGKWLHTQLLHCKLERDLVVANALVDMYGKCKSLEDATKVFNDISDKDVVSWNSIISVNVRLGNAEAALRLFKQMLQKGVNPSMITFVSILSACSSHSFLEEGKLIHKYIVYLGFDSDVAVLSGLVNMYSKCGSLEDTLRLFSGMYRRNLITWNAMITAYVQHGHITKAFQAFMQMQQEGLRPNMITFLSLVNGCSKPEALAMGQWLHGHIVSTALDSDVILGNALINMYARCGSVEDAFMVFAKLLNRDVASWNSMITAYAMHGLGVHALELFKQMEDQNVRANNITYAGILEVCADLTDLEKGRRIHAYMIESSFQSDIIVKNALVNMYGKCGSLKDSYQTFSEMSERDLVSWNGMLAACMKLEGKQALQTYGTLQVEKVLFDHITVVSVLSACSHAGMVCEGCHYFFSFSRCYDMGLTVEHYGCMVDLLGRAGRLEEAECLISSTPYQASAALWMTLLGACKLYLDIDRAKRITEHLLELDPGNAAPHLLLSNIYAALGMWEDVSKLRKSMHTQGAQDCPAQSLIEITKENLEVGVGFPGLPQGNATEKAVSLDENSSLYVDAA